MLPTVPPSPFLKRSTGGLSIRRFKNLLVQQVKAISPKNPLKYGCLMAVIPPPIAKQLTDWTLETVPDFHLGEGGRESVPHVTLRFGFLDSSSATVEAVKAFMSQYGPIPVRLDKLDLFTSGYGKWKNEDGDVLHCTVDSPTLHKINGGLSEAFPCHDTHPEYRPHVTLCYLDPGEVAKSYLKENPPFLGTTVMLDEMEWSGADGNKERFSLSIFPSFGIKGLEERKDKRGHRYCIETDNGKRIPCPKKDEPVKEKTKEEGTQKEKVKPQRKPRPPKVVESPVVKQENQPKVRSGGTLKANTSERWQKLSQVLDKVAKTVGQGLKNSSDLSEDVKVEYGMAVAKVLKKMPSAARKIANYNIHSASFYATGKELSEAVIETAYANGSVLPPHVEKGVINGTIRIAGAVTRTSGWFADRQHLMLDGKPPVGFGHRGFYEDNTGRIDGTYAHEFGHLIDGPDYKFSDSDDWDEAFVKEIARNRPGPNGVKVPPLTDYAKQDRHEAFAEFARLLFGSDFMLEEIEKNFPIASQIFKDNDLWPQRDGVPDAVFEDLFDIKIPLGDKGEHADAKKVGGEGKKVLIKAFEEKKDKRGHRYCVDDGRVKCPDQGQGEEGKTQKRGHPPKPPAAKPQEEYQVPLGDTPPPPVHFPDVTREEVITRGDVTKGVRGRPREGKDRTEKARHKRKEIAQNLKKASVVDVTSLNAGKNVTQIITLKNGGKAVFKPKSGEGEMNENGVRSSLRSSIPLGTYYLREAASYNLAETLGFGDLVPVTVLKEVNGETGSAQQHIANCSVAMDLELGRWDGPEDMTRAAVFDFVSMNSDRHTGNWLIAEDGKIRLIDNGLSFPEDVWDAFIDNSFLVKMCFLTDAPIPELVKTWGEKEFTAARETLKKSQLPEKAIELTLGRMKALQATTRTNFRAFIVDCRRAGLMQ